MAKYLISKVLDDHESYRVKDLEKDVSSIGKLYTLKGISNLVAHRCKEHEKSARDLFEISRINIDGEQFGVLERILDGEPWHRIRTLVHG